MPLYKLNFKVHRRPNPRCFFYTVQSKQPTALALFIELKDERALMLDVITSERTGPNTRAVTGKRKTMIHADDVENIGVETVLTLPDAEPDEANH